MFNLLLGHLVGDYLLQTNWMALNKHKNDVEGWLACTIHCLLYAAAVALFMSPFIRPDTMLIIAFITHFPLDKFGLADKYLKAIGGRSPSEWLIDMKQQQMILGKDAIPTPEAMLSAGFTAFVYAVCDNTMHMLLMWLVLMVIL